MSAAKWVVLPGNKIKRLRNKKAHGGCCRKCRRMSTSGYRKEFHRACRREIKAALQVIDLDNFSQPVVRMRWDIWATLHSRSRP